MVNDHSWVGLRFSPLFHPMMIFNIRKKNDPKPNNNSDNPMCKYEQQTRNDWLLPSTGSIRFFIGLPACYGV